MYVPGRNDPRGGRRLVSGFTLIELLAVVAIILLLIAFLIPMISRARNRTYDSLCAAKQKVYIHAYQCYSNDHNDVVFDPCSPGQMVAYCAANPPTPAGYYSSCIWLTYIWLSPYCCSETDSNWMPKAYYWFDPAQKVDTSKSDSTVGSMYWWGYGYPCSMVFDRGGGSATRRIGADFPVRVSEFPSPSTTAAFLCHYCVEGHFIGTLVINLNGNYDPWAFHGAPANTGFYGGGSQTIVSRMDGSVRTYQWSEIVRPNCHSSNYSDYQISHYGGNIARNYLYSGFAHDGWMAE